MLRDQAPPVWDSIVVAGRFSRRSSQDVIRRRRLHGGLFRTAAIVRRKSQLVQGELVDDWTTFTTSEASKRGPLLKSRLVGDARMYKEVLDNELPQDPAEGVNYSKNTLKKHFLKGTRNCQEFLASVQDANQRKIVHQQCQGTASTSACRRRSRST